MKHLSCLLACVCLAMPLLAFPGDANEAIEPLATGPDSLNLLGDGTLSEWKIPSDRWSLEGGTIVGHTGGGKLTHSEWLYSKRAFRDFVLSCELRLTGDESRNTGIYFRARLIQFEGHQRKLPPTEAPAGYEFDAAAFNPGKRDFRGTLGDYYARPALRIFPDPTIINLAFKIDDWNRMTLRARGNRLEYWLNGIKIMDYVDHDPAGSREGIIGLQLHAGAVMKVEYRDVRVRPLASPTAQP